ncbi:PilZ domain-containing protein [Dactylosporangium salmoneum]|uniref:PilZ domain-containing protein n=1 Tax=Dactylosporangium salmoneum TaxID=53361 RepID=UPI0031CDCED1
MTDRPGVNGLLYVAGSGDASYKTRVEDLEGTALTIAAPIGAGDVEPPEEGAEFQVFWTNTTRNRSILPVRLVGITKESPKRWQLEIVGDVVRDTRRRFVRGAHGTPIHLAAAGSSRSLEIEVVDLSEGGVRCHDPERMFQIGDLVAVSLPLGAVRTDQIGVVHATRDTDDGLAEIVLTYEPEERVAQLIRQLVYSWEIEQRRRERDLADR